MLKSRSHKNIHMWLCGLTVIIFILAGFCIYNWYKITSGNLIIDFKSDGAYITVIIAVAGFLAAFSAISIYSIFNANIDREREEIERLEEQLREKINHWNRLIDEAKEERDYIKYDLKESSMTLLTSFENLQRIVDLTSSYSAVFKKKGAIMHFKNRPIADPALKEFIYKFFLDYQKKDDKDKKICSDLKDLLIIWGKIK